jgi:hypothetical protein
MTVVEINYDFFNVYDVHKVENNFEFPEILRQNRKQATAPQAQ